MYFFELRTPDMPYFQAELAVRLGIILPYLGLYVWSFFIPARDHTAIGMAHRWFVFLLIFLGLLWGAAKSGVAQLHNNDIIIYLSVLFSLVSFSFITLRQTLVYILLPFGVMLACILFFQPDTYHRINNAVITSIFTLLAWFFSRYLYNTKLKDFINTRTISQQNQQLNQELELARRIQLSYIPQVTPWDTISYFYHPMVKVGGDYFDFEVLDDNRLGIFISDVSGHGVSAAFITTILKSLFKEHAPRNESPALVLQAINARIFNLTDENFITAFYAILDRANCTLTYANAGHNLPILVTASYTAYLESLYSGIPLGVLNEEELHQLERDYQDQTVPLRGVKKLLFYTDGIMETVRLQDKQVNPDGLLEDFEQSRFMSLVRDYQDLGSRQLIDRLIEQLVNFRGGPEFDDDICVLCIEMA